MGGGMGNQGVTGQPQGNTGMATTGGTGGGQHGVSGELLPPQHRPAAEAKLLVKLLYLQCATCRSLPVP